MKGRRSHRHWPLFLTTLICTLVLTAAVMQTSMARGRLAFYPRMDDVMYMARGAEIVRTARQTWSNSGAVSAIVAVARDWRLRPPHSPWSSGAAAIGFAVFGFHEWAAYVPTALPVLAMLIFCSRMARRAGGRGAWRAHALVVVAATAPFLAASVYILKPDYAAGFFSAIAMATALSGSIVVAPLRRRIWIGGLFGLALLAKPAMVAPTTMLFVGTLAICTARDMFLHRANGKALLCLRGRLLSAWAVTAAAMVLVALPHYAVALKAELRYSVDTLSGKGVDMWGYAGTVGDHLAYYLIGQGGRLMFDGLRCLIPAVLVLAVFGYLALKRCPRLRSRRVVYFAALIAALTMAWAGPTIAIVKVPQFASCFSALLWISVVYAAAAICRMVDSVPRSPLSRSLTVGLLIGGLLAARIVCYRWTFPLWPSDRAIPARAKRDARDESVRHTYDLIRAEVANGAKTVLVAGPQYDLAWALLTLWGVRDGAPLSIQELQRRPDDSDTSEAEQTIRDRFAQSDVVLVGDGVARKDIPNVIDGPAEQYYLRLARTDIGLTLIARVPDPSTGGGFEVYRRRSLSLPSDVAPARPSPP